MIRKLYILMTGFVLVMIHGCGEEDYPVPPASTVPKFTVAIDNNEFAPAQATFANVSIIPDRAGAVVYSWSFGDGTSSTEKDPVHLYKRPGAYDVNLVIVTSNSNEIIESEMRLVIKDPNATGIPIYFTDGSEVLTALINEQAPLPSSTGIKSLSDGYGIAVDTAHDKLYIAENGTNKILVANIDGTGLAEFRTGIGTTNAVAIDYANNMLYWDTDTGIRRTKLDNDNVTAYEDFVTGQAIDPTGMSVDPVNKRLYWNTYDGGVWRKNVDGTSQEEFIPGAGGGGVLVVGDRLYYDTYNLVSETADMMTVDLGRTTTPLAIVSAMPNIVYGIAYDGSEDKVYWNDRGNDRIMRANADGTSPEPWYTGVTSRGLAIGKIK
ncbi:PKD domain-containing protein [Parachryseolinea silvisoli]|uniref:PKD domain-containing protein n=1 Tax=Parachryseolinea silvisoli TaxID=2873601 RepID=UPI002265F610|nr:PKD domain-containing protein [Parachryseolinea silvisoli]MCD9017893.1 PKD domain-containing protein [Parachryseolinea silvisoli]